MHASTVRSDDLVPVHINVGVSGLRIVEYFCWDESSEAEIDAFAQMLCEEAFARDSGGVEPTERVGLSRTVATEIRQQVQDYKQAKEKLFCKDYRGRECLELIKLDFRIGAYHIRDQFEWDIANPEASPEDFAYTFCQELGVGTDVACRLAWHIRDQVYKLQKLGKSTGSIPSPTINEAVPASELHILETESGEKVKLRRVYASWLARPRSEWSKFTPSVLRLPQDFVEELEAEAENERKMRLVVKQEAVRIGQQSAVPSKQR